MTTLTDQEIERNMRAVDHAIGQQELEGLKVPEATVADLRRAARGGSRPRSHPQHSPPVQAWPRIRTMIHI